MTWEQLSYDYTKVRLRSKPGEKEADNPHSQACTCISVEKASDEHDQYTSVHRI